MMATHLALAGAALLAGVLLSGCVTGSGDTSGAGMMNAGPPPIGGLVAGSIGQQLGEAERRRAYDAELAALAGGQRTTWRGDKSSFGYVEPGAGSGGDCREYTHTIYIDGRPQRAVGKACRKADGSWALAS